MKFIIDIGHPAHVHMYHYVAQHLIEHGHQVLFTCRDKEFEVLLLQHFGFNYVNFGKKHCSSIVKACDLVRFVCKEIWVALKFRPDMFLSHGSPIATIAGWLLNIPHITPEDTFNMEQVRFYVPFSTVVPVADYPNPLVGRKNVLVYHGYKELMSLHPNQFTPDEHILDELGVINEKGIMCTHSGVHYNPYVIVRFVGWHATHDRGHHGITLENKIKAINEFSKYAKVIISSEGKMPEELESYRAKIDPARMHDAEAFASLIFGESSTMVAEGAVLGVPGIFMDNTGRLFTKQLEDDYQLCYNLSESPQDQERAIQLGIDILSNPQSAALYQQRRLKMLTDKIDVTSWFVWLVENYPQSVEECKKADFDWNQFK